MQPASRSDNVCPFVLPNFVRVFYQIFVEVALTPERRRATYREVLLPVRSRTATLKKYFKRGILSATPFMEEEKKAHRHFKDFDQNFMS